MLLERAEVAADARPAELIVERGSPDRPVEHDLQGRGDPRRLADAVLPRLLVSGDPQVRHRIAHQPGLGFGAAPRCALVANLAAGTGCRAGVRRDCGGVVVRLDLDQYVDGFARAAIDAASGIREPTQASGYALDDRGVVAIRGEHALRSQSMRVANHVEQRTITGRAIDDPARIEDLVPAVLGVGLGEHHQFDIGRVATGRGERRDQVVDLIGRQGEAELLIRLFDCSTSRCQRDTAQRAWTMPLEKSLRLRRVEQRGFRHAVVQQRCEPIELRRRQRARRVQTVRDATFDAPHRRQTAHPCDISGLARPRRDRAKARDDETFGRLTSRDHSRSGQRRSQGHRRGRRVDSRRTRPVGQK